MISSRTRWNRRYTWDTLTTRLSCTKLNSLNGLKLCRKNTIVKILFGLITHLHCIYTTRQFTDAFYYILLFIFFLLSLFLSPFCDNFNKTATADKIKYKNIKLNVCSINKQPPSPTQIGSHQEAPGSVIFPDPPYNSPASTVNLYPDPYEKSSFFIFVYIRFVYFFFLLMNPLRFDFYGITLIL